MKALVLLVVVYLLITCWNLNLQQIANPDEPRYAAPAREMLRGGSLIVPEYNTQPRLFKPILFYWLIALTGAAGHVVGLSMETAMRLGPVLAGLFALVGTFQLGRALFNARTALIAGLLLASTYFFHNIARELVVDMTLTAFVIWTNYFGFVAFKKIAHKQRATLPLLGFYLCMAGVSLTKGPLLAGVFCIVPVFLFLVWQRKLSWMLKAGLLWGVPLFLVVGLSWFVAVQLSGHDMTAFFMKENVGRALGRKDHQRYAPFVFYLQRLGEGFLPWVLMLPFALVWTFRNGFSPAKPLETTIVADSERGGIGADVVRPTTSTVSGSSASRYLACILLVPFIILGIAVSKRALYILPIYPCIALWIAHAWDAGFLSKEGRAPERWVPAAIKVAMLLLVAAGIYGVFAIAKVGALPREQIAAGLITLALAACGVLAATQLQQGGRFAASLLLLFGASFLVIGYESVARPIQERSADTARFYSQVKERLNGRRVVIVGHSANEAVWYLDRPKEVIDNLRYPELREKFFNSPGTMLLIPESELGKKKDGGRSLLEEAVTVEAVIQRADQTYFLAAPNPAVSPDPAIFQAVGRAGSEDPDEN